MVEGDDRKVGPGGSREKGDIEFEKLGAKNWSIGRRT